MWRVPRRGAAGCAEGLSICSAALQSGSVSPPLLQCVRFSLGVVSLFNRSVLRV